MLIYETIESVIKGIEELKKNQAGDNMENPIPTPVPQFDPIEELQGRVTALENLFDELRGRVDNLVNASTGTEPTNSVDRG